LQSPIVDYKAEFNIQLPVVLCVGRLFYVKGQDIAIKALAHLPSVALVLLGNGPEKANLEMLACRLGVSSRVFIWEARSDVYRFMKGCDIYVQPSRWEGFGIAALEAIASGAQVICSDVPGMKDNLVPLGATLFRSEDENSLAEMIATLLPKSSSVISTLTPDKFSIERVACSYLEEYSVGLHGRFEV
jgi:glycosyltransferase involved in cell wall biosynthesis